MTQLLVTAMLVTKYNSYQVTQVNFLSQACNTVTRWKQTDAAAAAADDDDDDNDDDDDDDNDGAGY